MSNVENWRPCKDGSVFNFIKTLIDNLRFITKREIIKSLKYESLKKCDNTKFERVQFRNEGAPFEIYNFHHKGARSMSNLGVIPEAILHSLVWFEAHRMWSSVTTWIKIKIKIFNYNKFGDECVKKLVHQDAWLQFIGQGKKRKDVK